MKPIPVLLAAALALAACRPKADGRIESVEWTGVPQGQIARLTCYVSKKYPDMEKHQSNPCESPGAVIEAARSYGWEYVGSVGHFILLRNTRPYFQGIYLSFEAKPY